MRGVYTLYSVLFSVSEDFYFVEMFRLSRHPAVGQKGVRLLAWEVVFNILYNVIWEFYCKDTNVVYYGVPTGYFSVRKLTWMVAFLYKNCIHQTPLPDYSED